MKTKSVIGAAILAASGWLALAEELHPTSADQTANERKEFVELEARAASGNAEAQDKLGVRYATGKGVQRDFTKAVELFRKAAAQNFAEAQYRAGAASEFAP